MFLFLSEINIIRKWGIVLVGLLLISLSSSAQVDGDYQTLAAGDWNANTTWQVRSSGAWVNCNPGDFPGVAAGAGTVYITGNYTISVTADVLNPIGALNFAGGAGSNLVQFTGAFNLDITGSITINPPTGGTNNNGIYINSGIVTCASITSANSGNNNRDCRVVISTGSLSVSGNITMGNSATQNDITFSDAGTLNVTGDIITGQITGFAGSTINAGAAFSPAAYNAINSTVNYNGADQNIGNYTYFNLSTSGSGVKTLPNASISVNGALDITNSTLAFTTTQARTLTVVGNLSGDGTIDMSSGNRTHALTLGGASNSIGGLISSPGFASTITYNRAGNQTIFGSPAYRNLTITGGGNKSLTGNTSIDATLTLTNGKIVLGSNDLTITGSATVASVTSARYIVADGSGQFKKVFAVGPTGAYVLPVGDASNYSPVTITYTNNSDLRTIGVRVTDDQHPDDGTTDNYISRYWTFTDDQAGTFTYTAAFTYVLGDLTGVHGNLRVNRRNGSLWTQYNTASASPVITLTGGTEITAPLNNSAFTGRVNSPSTYNWIKTGATGSWTDPLNWNPARLSPQPADILVFNNNGSTTATGVPTQTIGQLILSNNSDVSLQSGAAAQTLTITGAAGTDLDIQAGSILQISSLLGNQLGIVFNTATADVSIAGSLVINQNTAFSNSYTATNSNTVVFGSITNNGGNITSTAANLSFTGVSVYNHARNAGAIPAATWSNNSVINVTGTTAAAPTGFNQTFGNLNINCGFLTGSRTATLTAAAIVQGNLTVSGTSAINTMILNPAGFNFTVNGTTTLGAFGIINDSNSTGTNRFDNLVTINTDGQFISAANSPYEFRGGITNNGIFTKAGTGLVTFSTNASQSISGTSVFTFGGGDFVISDPASLDISSNINFRGTNLTNNSNTANALNASAGTFTFDLLGNQNINGTGTGSLDFYNLTAGGNSTKTINIPVDVTNDLAINNGVILSLGTTSKTINVLRNMTVDGSFNFGTAASTLNLTGDLFDITGVITMAGAGIAHQLNLGGINNAITTLTTTLNSGSSVNYTRTGSQQVFGSNNYQNINIAGGGVKSLQASAIINGVLNFTDGVFRLGAFNLTIANNATNAVQGTLSSINMIETDGAGALIRNAIAVLPISFPVGSGGFFSPATISAISATTGNISVIAVPAALGYNFVSKYWDVKLSVGPKTIAATFNYDPAEINIAPTNIWYKTPAGNWTAPAGTPGFGANAFTITGTTTITTTSTYWTAGALGTYYSYQTGDWNTPNTWTSDPSGTLQIGSSVPGINDKVIILTGRTVSLSSDIPTEGLDVTIDAGGYLNLTDKKFTESLAALSGQGTLRLASTDFPGAVVNTFINAGGGTTEYFNAYDFDLPTQTTYNNLTINAPGFTATQMNNLVLNGNLYVKDGTFRINDNLSVVKLSLTINGNVTVDNNGAISVGNGATNPDIGSVTSGGAAPFINYYTYFHTVIIKGNLTNNGTVRFTNLLNPVYDEFPSTVTDATTGAASVYFQGASDNSLTLNGTTDFYNLIVDKGTDQTFKLTINSSDFYNFRLFGANTLAGEAAGANANLRKALWIRNGTLELTGSLIIPSLTEGITSGSPGSDFYIPFNGALLLNGADVIVFVTADDFREINTAYNVSATDDGSIGISKGGNSALVVYGKLQVNDGYLSSRESGGIITTSVSSGQVIINDGVVDIKQFLSSTGSAQYSQSGGLLILRGRFQRIPTDYSTIPGLIDVTSGTLNTSRVLNGINAGYGTFNLENSSNIFSMAGGIIRIYDVCGTGVGEEEAFDVKSSLANINVLGGTVEIMPQAGSDLTDAVNFNLFTNAPLNNLLINRSGSSSIVLLNSPLTVLNDFNITSGDFSANNNNVTIGGDFTIANGTSYVAGTNTTTFNGTADQVFTINLAAPLSLNKLTFEKSAGININLAGSQNTIDVNDNFRLVLGTLNDNGNTINVAGDIFNSGVINGSGTIVLNGTVPQSIDGNGIFENVELNNATSPVSLAANMRINGDLTFSQDGLFNIGTNNLKLSGTSSIINAGPARYIQTAGNAGDGGLTKVYTSSATFNFPVGAPTLTPVHAVKYTPASIGFGSDPSVFGSITVIPVGYEHPNTTLNGQSLTYFWRVQSSGFSGIDPNSVIHTFSYNDIDVAGTEANYVPALYTSGDFIWRTGTNANPPINTSTNTITDWVTPTNSADFLDADYTAGDGAFGAPQIYYSRQTGFWNNTATWSLTGHTVDDPPGVVPGMNDIVIIGDQDSVSLVTNLTLADQGVQNCASLQIEKGSALDIGYNPGCNFGMVVTHPSGNGNFRLTTSQTSGSIFNFPGGDFSDFNVNKGTTEFYTTNATSGTIFILPYDVTSYGTVILSPLGGSNIIMPNNNSTTIYGDLITRGQNADSWLTMTWSGAAYANSNPALAIVPKTVYVKGNLLVQGGSFGWYQNGAVEQKIVIDGDVVVAALAGIDDWGGATNQSMEIGGSLINDANGLLNGVPTRAWCRFTNIPVTFFGDTSESITNTVGTPTTIFGRLTLNKGTTQANTLTCNIAGTLTTPADNWLILQNGTFRYMRTDPTADFNISTTTPFNIPATAGLYIDYANANGRNVLIANSGINANDLFLDGKLTLVNGNVYVGQVAGPNNNNDIEYSGSGASAIEVQGGNLVVNGQIRRPAASTNGILSYIQSGGNVTINGNAQLATKAKLEVLNIGSVFNMSGGNLTIVRGGGTTFGDLYLRPGASSVTGGTISFAHNLNNLPQVYGLESNVPLNNLVITGRTAATAANATVGIMVSPLVLNGSLTLTNTRSILNSNNINITIKGDLNNSGAYNYGTNLTTFNGSIQSVTGTTVTNFYDLDVSPTTSLTVNNSFTVNRNMNIGSGNLVLTSYLLTLLGDINNGGSYTDDNGTGGVILSGTIQQQVSGTGGFGRLNLNNANGTKTLNDITLQGNLVLTQGIFDISKNRVTLSQNSIVGGAPFGLTKYIRSDGVISSLGVRKFFTAVPQTFTFPVGVSGKYTPAYYDITASSTVGYINVNPVNNYHPSALDPARVLNFYWLIESSGISAFNGYLLLDYITGDVFGSESDYVAARLVMPANTWNKADAGPATDNVDETNNQIRFDYLASNNLNGEYTAGEDTAIPGTVPTYQTNSDGDWSDESIWTPVGGSPACPIGGPVGANVIIDHVVTTDIDNISVQNTTINDTLRIVFPTFGHNLGNVDGDGTIYLENGNLPGGDYTAFIDCSGNGTIEYGGSGTYTIIASQFSSLPNMFVTGTGSRILPNKDLTICKRLVIDGPTLDNSVNNRKLTILGSMERYNTGIFFSGSGASPAATVSFAGTAVQTLGGPTGDFTGSSKFNNLEINNINGLIIGANGLVEINNQLLLSNGKITTTSSNKLILLNTSSSAVVPSGGSSVSFVNGPLIKSIINGGTFLYPIGKGATKGHDLTVTSTSGSTLLWTAEYFTPNPTSASVNPPLTVVNTLEYWSVSTTVATTGKIKIGWSPTSDLTPLMTENGISDMRIADYSAGLWNELTSTTSGNDNIGDVATTNNVNISTVPKDFTTASISTTLARASLTPFGPVCGTAGIPVTFTSHDAISLNYTLDYTRNGAPQPTEIISSLPYVLPTPVPGSYKLTGFTYNNGADIGVVDGSIITAYSNPAAADAGLNQSNCGVSGTILVGNNPAPYTGLWTILLGSGGTFVDNTQFNTVFTGVLGVTYTLRWTISNGACTSFDDVVISFPVVAATPGAFTSGPTQVCKGSSGYVYTVPNDPGVTYAWSYTGTGHTINGTGNSVTIDFNAAATSGTLNVTATNSCGTSAQRSIGITVNSPPNPSVTGDNDVCPNETGVPYSTTNNPGNTYNWVVSGGVAIGTGSSISVNWGAAGPGTIRVTETNPVSGCTYTTADYGVTIHDNIAPVISGCPANIFINNDPGVCTTVVTWTEPTATDNCTPAGSLVWARSHLSGDTFPLGTTPVNYTATDASGNTSLVCTFNVTVTDNTVPVISLPVPPVLNADAFCSATVPIIAATATDNCSIPGNITISQAPAAGTVIGSGITVVTITATDEAGNSGVENINVTVVDVTKPVIVPPVDPTINLDNSCQAFVPNFLPALVVTDNCTAAGAITKTQNPAAGSTLTGAGTTNVLITATDAAGNSESITVIVTTKDVTAPLVACKDANLYVNGAGTAVLTVADVNNGSTDNCTVVLTYTLSKTNFNCSDIPAPVSVNLTGTDAAGNSSFCTSLVTVIDTVKPTVNVNTYNLILGPAGTGTLLPANVDAGTFDNCALASLTVAPNTFDCTDLGTQTVTLTAVDIYGNTKSKSVQITVSTSLNIDAMSLNSCDLAAPFALYSSEVSGGDGTYTYYWDVLEPGAEPFMYFDLVFPIIHFSGTSTAKTPLFNNLMPDGTYNIRLVVTDGNGCVDTSQMVMVKGGITYNNVTTRLSDACENQTKTYTVAFDATATYSWSVTNGTILTPANTNSIDVLWNLGGTQGVVIGNTVKPDLLGNDCGSSVVDTVSIHATPVPAFNSPVLNVCSNSEITYTLTNTYTSYTWTVTGGVKTAGGTASDNFVTVRWGAGPAGKVTVTVQNAFTCSGSVFVDIVIYNLSGTITSQTNVSCNGASDGQVTALATAGTGLAPYQYALDGGSYGASGTFTGLSIGNHTVTIRDALLCTFDLPFTITQPLALLGSISAQTNVSCNGLSDGSVTLSTSGGTAPYQYNIDGGAYQGSNIFNGLSAGAHTVLARDANLCTVTIPVTITQPTALTGGIALQTNVDCNGNSTGSVTVSGGGGTPAYQYSLDGGPYQVSGNFTGLAAGGYTVTVRDANLCTVIVPVTITQPSALSGSISSQTNVSCFGGSNGQVTVAGSGGSAPYQYRLNAGAYQALPTFTGLAANSYTVTIRDANLCTVIVPVTITQPAAGLSGNTVVTNVLCFGNATGAVDLTVAGGTAAYTYLWSNGATTQDLTNVVAGNYTVVITDANGCTANAAGNVTQPAAALSGSTVVTNVACFGGSTGAVNLTVSGGTAPYTFLWSNGATTEDLTNVTAGNYTVVITDANLCIANAAGNVTQPAAALSGSTVVTNVACFGGSTGAVNLTVSGGTAPYTYFWSNGATTQDLAGLTAGNYTVVITDFNGCTANAAGNVTQPAAALSGSTVVTNVACFGNATGAVDLTVAGGTAAYTYLWSNGAITQDLTNVVAGNYTVVITDANGCTANAAGNVTQPAAALTGSTLVTNVLCFGNATGAVNLTVSGGTGPYTFLWSNGAATEDLTNVVAGNYTVVITDANGCTANAAGNVTQPAVVSGSVSAQTNVLCFGDNTGSVTIAGLGGTAPYTYRIGVGLYQASGTFNTLSAATYTITVRDANLCTGTLNVTITEPAALTIVVASQTNVACYGTATGAVTVLAGGGVPAYQYSINAGPYQVSDTFTGLSAATYSITVRDANNCTTGFNITITQPGSALAGFITAQTNTTCNGSTDGSVTVAGSGGTPSYMYNIDGGTFQASGTFNGLDAGPHTVVVRDASLCTDNVNVTITEPSLITGAIITQVNVSCFGGSDGSITISGAGGTSPYQYSLDAGGYQASGTFNGLSAGPHVIIIRDLNGCTSNINFTITEPPLLTLGSTQSNVSCFGGSNGTATAIPAGGTGPYTYAWGTIPVQTGVTATGLIAGSYTVTVTDSKSCTANTTVIITQPVILSGSTVVTNVLCNSGATGAVNLTVAGGTAPYTYLWSNGATTQDLAGLTAGNYTVVITDFNGCTANAAGNVTQPAVLSGSTIVTNVLCNGGTTGAVDLSVVGGTAPYTYIWSNGTTTQDLAGVAAGNYTVIITDFNGCTANAAGNVTQPAVLSGSTIVTNVLCNGGTTGAVDLSVAGGTAPYTYLWSNGATTQDLAGVAAGNYTVVITDFNGCTANATGNVTQPAVLSGSTIVTNILCNGGTTGAVDLSVAGGTAPYTYLWSNGATTQDIAGLTAGNYTVVITDFNGCTANAAGNVAQPAVLSGSTIVTNVLCNGGATGTIDLTVSGGTAGYTFLWSNGATTEDLPAVAAGNYSVIITDANSCTANASGTVSESSALIGTIDSQIDVLCFGGNTGSVTVSGSGGTPGYLYRLGAGAYQASGTFNALTANSYNITVRDANMCTVVVPVTINQPAAALTASIGSQTNVLCFGNSTGSVTVSAGGGTSPYVYNIDAGSFQASATFGSLLAGIHTIVIRDANACVFNLPVNITQPATALSGSIVSQTNVLCFGGSTGSVTVAGSGGTPVYEYSIDAGPYQPLGTFNGLSNGVHTISVRDANLCTYNIIVSITQPASALSVSATKVDVLCNGAATGSATATASGGTLPYSYSWNTIPVQTTPTASSLTAGTYTVTVTDGNGCNTNTNVTISQPATAPSGSTVVTNVACFGGSTGAVNLTVSGGTAPYTFLWSNGATTEDLTNVIAGNYTVVITDASLCTANAAGNVTEPLALSGSTVVTNVLCNGGSTGAVDLTVSGGTGPYTFLWSNGATTEDLTNVVAGNYTVVITDANLCTANAAGNVTEPSALSGSTVVTNVLCFGGTTGAVDLTVSGGTGPYTFLWSNGATTEDLTNVAAGNYTVVITDANLCTANAAGNVTEPSALSGSTVVTNVLCNGGSTGAVDLTVSGGTGPYTFLWSNGATTEDLTNVAAGNYTVVITDANLCTANATGNVTEPLALSGSTVVTNVLCNGGSTGAVDLTVSGGTGPYTFLWSNGATTEDLTNVAAGNYTVVITDANLCTANAVGNVTEPAAVLSGSTSVTNVLCNGGSTGAVNLTVSGGTGPYTFLWSNGATTEDLTNVVAGNYTVVITDANLCTANAAGNVTEPAAALSGSTSVTNVLCNGGSTGAVNLTVSGGTATYTFLWSNGATTEDLTNVAAGNYTVVITDANLCTANAAGNVTEPSALSGSTVVTNVLCFSGTTGAVNLTVSGGTGPYTFLWSNGATTEDLTNVAAGNYTVVITDANLCTANAAGNVTEPAAVLSGSTVVTNVACFGGSTGAVNLTVSGGTSPYTFLWSNGATTEDLSGVVAGNYTVVITDANLCTANAAGNVIQPAAALSGSTVVTNVACFGGSTGAVNLTVSGGTAPYTFLWSNGATTEDLTNVIAGNYTVVITDASLCTANGAGNVTEPSALSGSTVVTNVLCFGGTTGAVNLTVSGGTAPYTFLWSNGATTEDLSGVVAGNYTVVITDASGCTANAAGNITEPAMAPSGSTSVTNVLCNGGSTGAVDLTVSGGTSPYTFLWSNGATTEDLSGVVAGNYTVVITDASGCTANAAGNITEPATAPLGSTSVTNVLCNGGSTGAVDLTVSGGTSPYTFLWSNGATTEDLSGVVAGNYTVVITDANLCTANAAGNVTEPIASVSGSTVVTNVLCNSGSTGAVDLIVSGGTLPYTFLWSNGATTEDLTNVVAGNYTVDITDANGCIANTAGNITEPASAVSGSIIAQNDVTVIGGNDGSVTVDGAGGTSPYLYKLDAGAFQASGIFSSLTAGSYSVTVQDANLCTVVVPVTITQPLAPLTGIKTSQADVLCFGGNNGSLTVTGLDGLSPYEYSLNAGPYQPSGTFDNLTAGSYTVTVRDALLSTFNVPVTITGPAAALTVNIIQTDILCNGSNTGSATATGSGGTGPYTYSWNTVPVQTAATATGLSASSFTVTVTDANGCITTGSVTISQPLLLTVSTSQTNVLCNGGANGTATAVASGGTGPYTYSWNTSPVQSVTTATGLSSGSYTVTVTDANSCAVTGNVTIAEPATLALDAVPTESGCPDSNDGSITLDITGGTAPYSVIWADAITTQNRTALLPGTYSVVVSDANGCNASTSAVVSFTGSFNCLVIPDIITPDPADGHNDEWIIRNIDIYPNAEVLIYTRWGRLVYKTKNISANPWNGRYSNGKLVPTDSYHYILYLNDGSEPRSGVISVIR